jgi:hypothetical protein
MAQMFELCPGGIVGFDRCRSSDGRLINDYHEAWSVFIVEQDRLPTES